MGLKRRVNRRSKGKASSASPESPKQSTKIKKTVASASKQNFEYKKQIAPALFISPSPSPSQSPLLSPSVSPPPIPSPPMMNCNNVKTKNLSSITDLKEMVVSRIDYLKRNLIDRSHSEILKDLEASHSRLHKRFKIQTHTCQQMMDEADKEYKKMSERIAETQDGMKASYAEFFANVQSTASTVCKTTIPELSRSFEKAIGGLQSRYGIR